MRLRIREFVVVLAICALAALCFAAAPALSRYASSQNSVTIDAQHTGAWDTVASVIMVHTDTCYGLMLVTGIAVMDPVDKLYLGLGNDSANRTSATNLAPNNNLDTCTIGPFKGLRGKSRIPFSWQYRWTSTNTTTDITDTVYVNAACGGSSGIEAVELEDVMISIDIADRD
jgi:hypothetical protein